MQKEASARIKVNKLLEESGWRFFDDKNGKQNIQLETNIKWNDLGDDFQGRSNNSGFIDFLLLDSNSNPLVVIEAKREEEAHKLNVHEDQSKGYATAKLKHLKNEPLPFVYISTGEVTRIIDFRDPKPRTREIFSFHRPETLRDWLKNDKSLRKRLFDLPVLQTQGLRECQIAAINKLETTF